ncbi:ADP-ribosylglycohydrolase [Crossiella equi]|uniref:ADP-ribosylglycohydrolase n=1 Tax=Crossiella equi TaxID=130796 RepID=A0ABS5AHT7_9PSEU|nr:ADP-ribosylglycohydrolase family protein [Crossiella equi]MBP2476131.1 ADP-ribosylglycohydrolase [Crossiella equi]
MSAPAKSEAKGIPLDERGYHRARERFIGCYVGQAIGGAVGAGVQTTTRQEFAATYGEAWPEGYPEVFGGRGLITGETQLSLFVLDGVIRAQIRRRRTGSADPVAEVRRGLFRWLQTQEPRLGGPADGWLPSLPGLAVKRWPDHDTLEVLRSGRTGTPTERVNESRSSAAVARAAAAALWSADRAEVFDLAMAIAALTHGHPVAQLTAGAYAAMVHTFLSGLNNPRRAVYAALDELQNRPGHEPVTEALTRVIEPGAEDRELEVDAAYLERFGGGWQAHEALAMAVQAAFVAPRFDLVLATAIGHSGNSSTVGALAVSIQNLVYNFTTNIPVPYMRDLELGKEIAMLADGAATEFGPEPYQGTKWFENFPIST